MGHIICSRQNIGSFACVSALLSFFIVEVQGQDSLLDAFDKPPVAMTASEKLPAAVQDQENFERLTKLLKAKKLVGHFTVDGRPLKDLHEEVYEIKDIKKLEEADLWLIVSRIKYGEHDVTVPLAITILWAGNTPVITLDDFSIPGMGTFSARVVFHEGKYSGTWTHDRVGGHLFGRIEPNEPEPQGTSPTTNDPEK